jgi:hypothetical protein
VAGREPRPPVFNPEVRFPEWRVGTWWQIQFRQRAMMAMHPNPGWTLPTNVIFEVVAEKRVDDTPCYQLRVPSP